MAYSIDRVNQMDREEFLEVFGVIFEQTPAIAAQAWHGRPFQTVEELSQAMVNMVNSFSTEEQLNLIKAHPDLGSKAKMAEDSVKEQTGAGLDRLNLEEYNQFQFLNQSYKDKFGFPFIIAVKNHTKTSILENFQLRLDNSQDRERQQALAEILKIARFRINERVVDRE